MLGSSESSLKSVETRPAYLDAWLNNLPYLNFERTLVLLEGALRQTNALKIKPPIRLELLERYVRPYQYLLDSQIRGKLKKGQQPLARLQRDVQALKRVANELALGCKLVINDPAYGKSRWRNNKLLPRATFLAVKRLSHVLLLNFQDYSPTPRDVWRELFDIVQQSNQAGHLDSAIENNEADPPSHSSVLREFKRLLLTALVDPYHEAYGAVWDIYELADQWADAAKLLAFDRPEDTRGLFALDLMADQGPQPLARFQGEATDSLRLIDCRQVLHDLQNYMKVAAAPGAAHKDKLDLCRHLWRAWSSPPLRELSRNPQKGLVEIASGLHAAFFHLNQGRDLEETASRHAGILVDGEGDATAESAPSEARYAAYEWTLSNTSVGGAAFYAAERDLPFLPVGELVAVRAKGDALGGFRIGVIRWLVIQQQAACKMGIEWLAPAPKVARLQLLDQASGNSASRRALYLSDGKAPASLITGTDVYAGHRSLLLTLGDKQQEVTIGELLERTTRFARFVIQDA